LVSQFRINMNSNSNSSTLLVEILTEELPPKNLFNLANHFGNSIFNDLKKYGLLLTDSQLTNFATPRRLALVINNVLANQEDYWINKKGPAIINAYDQNHQPTKALLGFAKSCNLEIDQLGKMKDGDREIISAKILIKGDTIDKQIKDILENAINALPISKKMRWQNIKDSFVRPVHNITILFGDRIINFEKWNIKSDRITQGHRFLGKKNINILNANSYQNQLEDEGKVIPSFDKRQQIIIEQLDLAAKKINYVWIRNQQLLDEVTALTEYPVVLAGEFTEEFLKIPAEALIVTMTSHQKYFPVVDKNQKIINRFLVVANIEPAKDNPENIVKGNERVLKARLSDAQFFYENDCKIKLIDRIELLEKVTYLNELNLNQKAEKKVGGSQAERVNRIVEISKLISQALASQNRQLLQDVILCSKLAKADLVSEIVGEFPELQGIAGSYYALAQGINSHVALAIREHYQPKFSGDNLPETQIGQIVALSDKLETIFSIFGVGKIPTGEKDPYALRRQALGIIRILFEKKLPLDLQIIYQNISDIFANTTWNSCEDEVHNYLLDRLRYYLRDNNFKVSLIESVITSSPTRFDDLFQRLQALKEFINKPEAESLITIGKRIRNILKSVSQLPQIDESLFIENSERDLYQCFQKNQNIMIENFNKGDFLKYLQVAISFETPLANFFDQVMVMVENSKLRNNRLSLLNQINQLINKVGNISELVI